MRLEHLNVRRRGIYFGSNVEILSFDLNSVLGRESPAQQPISYPPYLGQKYFYSSDRLNRSNSQFEHSQRELGIGTKGTADNEVVK